LREENEQGNLIDPRARRWEAEWNVLREVAGLGMVQIEEAK